MTRRTGVTAFEQFFLGEHPKLVALGLAWTGNPETARELAQEALVRAYRSWDRVADLDIPGAWVRRVMINLLIDARRGEQRTVTLRHRLAAPLSVATGDVLDDIDHQWWDAVRALPDRERAAVTLHYLEDLPIAEVAEILEVAPGTVKSSLSHARQKLRIALSTSEDER
jgi:RNA polymerase sigma-70 factor (ECF subfamily)